MSEEVDAWMRAGARRQRRWQLAGAIAICIASAVGLTVWFLVGSNAVPVGEQRAIHAVEAAGMSNVILGGVDLLACSDSESSRHFAAINPAGKRVQGTVCCGLSGVGKACTLRWDR